MCAGAGQVGFLAETAEQYAAAMLTILAQFESEKQNAAQGNALESKSEKQTSISSSADSLAPPGSLTRIQQNARLHTLKFGEENFARSLDGNHCTVPDKRALVPVLAMMFPSDESVSLAQKR
jgi:hypothetical protein